MKIKQIILHILRNLFTFSALSLMGCAEKITSVDNAEKKDSMHVVNELTDDESENSNNNEKKEDMIDISDLFSSEELDKIRCN